MISAGVAGSDIVVAAVSSQRHRCGTDVADSAMVADLVSLAASSLCVI
jgi:hypothetical protein